MSSDVISHHRPRRKRGSWWTYFARRFGALLLTMLALGFASFLAPLVRPQTKALAPPPRLEAPVQTAQPEVQEIDVTPALAGPPPRSRPRRERRLSGIPLDAAADHRSDGYEILSAAELDAISQARD